MSNEESPTQPDMAKRTQVSTGFKLFMTFWAFMENLLFAGLRAGWSALVYVLKQENIYSYLCDDELARSAESRTQASGASENRTKPFALRLSPNDSLSPSSSFNSYNSGSNSGDGSNITVYNLFGGAKSEIYNLAKDKLSALGASNASSNFTVTPVYGCHAQDAEFNQCFTIASATMAISALLYGHLNYKYGIRLPRLLSVLIFTLGSLTFAFVDKDLPWLIYPGLLLVSSGGMALYLTNNQISYMFSTGGAAVVGLLCGALEASSFVQTIIKIAYENGVSLQYSYLTLTGLYQLTLISTFFMFPKDFIVNAKSVPTATKKYTTMVDGNKNNNTKTIDSNGSISFKASEKSDQNGTVDLENKIGNKENGNVISEVGFNSSESGINKIVNGNDKVAEGKASKECSQINSVNSVAEKEDVAAVERDDVHVTESSSVQLEDNDETVINKMKSDAKQSRKPAPMQVEFDYTLEVAPPSPHIESNSSLETKRHSQQSDVLMSQSKGQNGRGEGHDVTAIPQSRSFLGGVSGSKTLWQCILSKTFFLYLFWASVVQIILLMCLGTFNPWLEYVTDKNDDEVSKYTDVLYYSMLGSPILSLGMGLGIDAMKKVDPKDPTTANVKTLRSATVSLGVTSILSVIVCALVTTCHQDVIIATSIALVIFRTALYCCGTTFLRIMYPTHYFGMLCGIMSVLSGTIGFVQYPLFLWVQYADEAWMEAFGFLGLLGIVSLAQPGYLLWKSRQLRRQNVSADGAMGNEQE